MGWEHAIGLGVAGNFTGHLEQAGEASDFAALEIRDARAPKGVFPFYVPLPAGARSDHFLHRYPVSSDRLRLGSDAERHQIEPEVALLCDLDYREGRVVGLTPRRAMAHDDCSIRREGAKKISEKKNWGPESKGTAHRAIELDRFEEGGVLDDYRIASFLWRRGTLHEYGVDSPVSGYSFMYGRLLEWLVDRLSHQVDEGPLEHIAHWLEVADHPRQALISIGATRYTEFGESHFLERGDRAIVALYDGRRLTRADIARIATNAEAAPEEGLSLLCQEVV